MKSLCIIAGSGDLPWRIYEKAPRNRWKDVRVLALKGYADKKRVRAAGDRASWATLTSIASSLEVLQGEGVGQLVMAGAFRRPSLASMTSWDRKSLALAKDIVWNGKGDDHLLRKVIGHLEKMNFEVLGLKDILGKNIMVQKKYCGKIEGNKDDARDIAHAGMVAGQLFATDVGQSLVVQQGVIVAVEAMEGTDRMIKRAGVLLRKGRGGIVLKFKKKNQDERVDLPVIGSQTIHSCRKAGMAGIALEEGGVLVLDEEEVLHLADRYGLFVTTFAPLHS